MKEKRTLRSLTEGAAMVAMALALSFFKFRLFPTGGSVDLVMIPLIIYALRRGGAWGIGAGLVFGVLKCIISGAVSYGWQALILDYGVAYAVVGIAGFLPKKPILATVAGSCGRYLIHIVSGVVIWGEWMPDEFLGLAMSNIWVYSLLYNATYMLPNAVIAAIAVGVIARRPKLMEMYL